MQQKVKSSKNEKNAEKGMVIERRFTSAGEDPFEKFDWIEMDAEIRNPDGSMADSITCLLYTSPSPRDRQKSRMPSSA